MLRLMLLGNAIEMSQATVTKYQRGLFTDQRISVSINLNNTEH